MSEDIGHVSGIGLYTKIYFLLLALLVATVGAAMIHLPGHLSIALAMVIATTKAFFIVMYFMHMKWSGKLVAVMFLSSLYVMGIGFVLMSADYLYR